MFLRGKVPMDADPYGERHKVSEVENVMKRLQSLFFIIIIKKWMYKDTMMP